MSKTTTQLTTAASNKILPRISGHRVVWSDDRNGNLDLYSYDLSTQMEEALVTGPGDQFQPDVDGDRVVYSGNQAGFEQFYLFTVGPPNDFSISANPTGLGLHQGASGASLISTAVTSGSAPMVGLTVSGVPSGLSASLNATSVTAGGSSTLTVNAGTAAPGLYTLIVTGVEGSMMHTTSVTLTVTGPQVSGTPATLISAR